jgi:hypothetical protein
VKAMSESEWVTCMDPVQMLGYLRHCKVRFRPTERTWRLFVCAYWREFLWKTFPWEWYESLREVVREAADQVRETVAVAEQYADGSVGSRELAVAREAALRVGEGLRSYRQFGSPSCVAPHRPRSLPALFSLAADAAAPSVRDAAISLVNTHPEAAQVAQLLHDIVGLPFRGTQIEPAWLAWNDGAVPKIAKGIYAERAFDRLPIFADAMEEAGCSDAAILEHCRSPGPHVRGCWVVDLLLGKK